MKTEPPSEYLRECLDYYPLDGRLVWRVRPSEHFQTKLAAASWNTRYAGKDAGRKTENGYRTFRLTVGGKKKEIFCHRAIWAMETGVWPINDIDHENTVRDDNRFVNLREATRSENKRNSGPHRDNKLGLKGVRLDRKRFQANINFGGKQVYLGTFDTAEAAASAYRSASAKYHGEFARS